MFAIDLVRSPKDRICFNAVSSSAVNAFAWPFACKILETATCALASGMVMLLVTIRWALEQRPRKKVKGDQGNDMQQPKCEVM